MKLKIRSLGRGIVDVGVMVEVSGCTSRSNMQLVVCWWMEVVEIDVFECAPRDSGGVVC